MSPSQAEDVNESRVCAPPEPLGKGRTATRHERFLNRRVSTSRKLVKAIPVEGRSSFPGYSRRWCRRLPPPIPAGLCPARNAGPDFLKRIPALRAQQGRQACSGAPPLAPARGIPRLPRCACAALRCAPPFPLSLRFVSRVGDPPPLAVATPRLRQEAFGM